MEIAFYRSPIGWVEISAQDECICGVRFISKPPAGFSSRAQKSPVLRSCLTQLREYFSGRRQSFRLPLRKNGSAFQEKVWARLCRIKRGRTQSYAEIARGIGQPKAARAVGGAVSANPIALIVPCHRVIGARGALGGYAFGRIKKDWLLEMETGKKFL